MNTPLAFWRDYKRRQPQAVGIFGGHLASASADAILEGEPSVDMVLRGDAEESFPQLIDTLLDDGALDAVPGLIYRHGDAVRHSPIHAHNPDLDTLPLA